MAPSASRVLALLELLQAHHRLTGPELATRWLFYFHIRQNVNTPARMWLRPKALRRGAQPPATAFDAAWQRSAERPWCSTGIPPPNLEDLL
jgi:hypothetical protein